MKIRWPWVKQERVNEAVGTVDVQWKELYDQRGSMWQKEVSELRSEIADLQSQIAEQKSGIENIVNRVRVSENELGGWLNVPDDHPVLKGVLEVLARNEDALVRDSLGEDLPVQARLDLSAGLRAVRNARLDVAHAVIEARRPKKH